MGEMCWRNEETKKKFKNGIPRDWHNSCDTEEMLRPALVLAKQTTEREEQS